MCVLGGGAGHILRSCGWGLGSLALSYTGIESVTSFSGLLGSGPNEVWDKEVVVVAGGAGQTGGVASGWLGAMEKCRPEGVGSTGEAQRHGSWSYLRELCSACSHPPDTRVSSLRAHQARLLSLTEGN